MSNTQKVQQKTRTSNKTAKAKDAARREARELRGKAWRENWERRRAENPEPAPAPAAPEPHIGTRLATILEAIRGLNCESDEAADKFFMAAMQIPLKDHVARVMEVHQTVFRFSALAHVTARAAEGAEEWSASACMATTLDSLSDGLSDVTDTLATLAAELGRDPMAPATGEVTP